MHGHTVRSALCFPFPFFFFFFILVFLSYDKGRDTFIYVNLAEHLDDTWIEGINIF